jgi:hypothetical protein
MFAMATSRIQPGNADTIAFLDVQDVGANGERMAYTLVARDERGFCVR